MFLLSLLKSLIGTNVSWYFHNFLIFSKLKELLKYNKYLEIFQYILYYTIILHNFQYISKNSHNHYYSYLSPLSIIDCNRFLFFSLSGSILIISFNCFIISWSSFSILAIDISCSRISILLGNLSSAS